MRFAFAGKPKNRLVVYPGFLETGKMKIHVSHCYDFVEVKDFDAIKSACRRLDLMVPIHGKVKCLRGEVESVLIELSDWFYPVVCDLLTGIIKYDNFNGEWGNKKHPDQFVQTYSIEKATIEARNFTRNTCKI